MYVYTYLHVFFVRPSVSGCFCVWAIIKMLYETQHKGLHTATPGSIPASYLVPYALPEVIPRSQEPEVDPEHHQETKRKEAHSLPFSYCSGAAHRINKTGNSLL